MVLSRKRGRVAGVLAVVALATTLAAVATAGTHGSTAQTSVKIGVLASTDGPVVKTPAGVAAIKAWARALNAKGGLGGKVKVELVHCNTKNDANLATACARQMATEQVALVIGNDSPTGPNSFPLLEAAKIPSIGLFASFAGELTSPYSYPLDGGGFLGFMPAINVVAKKFSPNAAFVSVDVPQGRTNSVIVKAATTPPVNWVTTVYVPFTTADYAPVVANVVSNKPKSALLFTGAAMGADFIRAAEQANAGIDHYVWLSVDTPSLGSLPGPARAKVVAASAYKPVAVLTKEKNKLLARLIKELQAEVKAGNAEAKPNLIAGFTWNYYLSGIVLEQLAKTIKGDITAASVKAALDNAKNLDLGGVASPWTPSAKGPSPELIRVSNPRYFVYQYQANGVPKLLVPKAVTTAEAAAVK